MELGGRMRAWRVRHSRVVARATGECVLGGQGTPVEVSGRPSHRVGYQEPWDARVERAGKPRAET